MAETAEQKASYLPTTLDEWDPEVAKTFTDLLDVAAEGYVEEREEENQPTTLMDFAVHLIYTLGASAGRQVFVPGKPDGGD